MTAHISEFFLETIVKCKTFPFDVLKYVREGSFPIENLFTCYEEALKRGNPDMILAFHQRPEIKAAFAFVGRKELESFLGNPKMLVKLTLPVKYLRGCSFDGMLERIFGRNEVSRYRKRIGRAFLNQGTHLLNNLFILSAFMDVEENLDAIIAWKHHKSIDADSYRHSKIEDDELSKLLRSWSPRKTFKILLSYEFDPDEGAWEFITTGILRLREIDPDAGDRLSQELLRTKAESVQEIHSEVEIALKRAELSSGGLKLHQPLEVLDGRTFYGFKISVPKNEVDLMEVGKKMRNCLDGHTRKIRISRGRLQIITLCRGDKPILAVEIKAGEKGYKIKRVEKSRNREGFEGSGGARMKAKLLELIEKYVPTIDDNQGLNMLVKEIYDLLKRAFSKEYADSMMGDLESSNNTELLEIILEHLEQINQSCFVPLLKSYFKKYQSNFRTLHLLAAQLAAFARYSQLQAFAINKKLKAFAAEVGIFTASVPTTNMNAFQMFLELGNPLALHHHMDDLEQGEAYVLILKRNLRIKYGLIFKVSKGSLYLERGVKPGMEELEPFEYHLAGKVEAELCKVLGLKSLSEDPGLFDQVDRLTEFERLLG